MFGSEMLDIVISLVFVYLLLSLICSAIREGIETVLKQRAVYLERGIREMLNDRTGEGLTQELYNHPFIFSLFQGDYQADKLNNKKYWPILSNLPTYIPPRSFAIALLDVVTRGPVEKGAAATQAATIEPTLSEIRASIAKIENNYVQRALLSAMDSGQDSVEKTLKNIEAWYDSTMERVSGAYKRRTQIILFFLGFGLTAILNVNTITIAQALAQNDTMRDVIVAQAQALVNQSNATQQTADFKQAYDKLNQLNLPIGWSNGWSGTQTAGLWASIVDSIIGWLMTAFAISFGAPFWFDLLNKFMVVRSTVKPTDKKPPDASTDRRKSTDEVGAPAN